MMHVLMASLSLEELTCSANVKIDSFTRTVLVHVVTPRQHSFVVRNFWRTHCMQHGKILYACDLIIHERPLFAQRQAMRTWSTPIVVDHTRQARLFLGSDKTGGQGVIAHSNTLNERYRTGTPPNCAESRSFYRIFF